MKLTIILLLCMMIATTGFSPNQDDVPTLNGHYSSEEQLTQKLKAIVDSAKVTGLSVVVMKNRVIMCRNYLGAKNAGRIVETTMGDKYSPLKWLGYYDQH